ncbi:hypothetical protein OS493_035644 [Desmophyllum pertusum]|uniref:Uncharacterized protein n=1 Tax=Desmophyllum pertusum TaxID=174260 RepID=A0A9W9Z938_9CNID|nr:hypothetical protein OS493_035644 [Desmophyllum pertusum]
MPDEQTPRSETKERSSRTRKRTREGSLQTDEEDAAENHKHGCKQTCKQCFDMTNFRLSGIEDKLSMLLNILPELEGYKSRITQLEEENKSMQKSLEYSHAEIKDLKSQLKDVNSHWPKETVPCLQKSFSFGNLSSL